MSAFSPNLGHPGQTFREEKTEFEEGLHSSVRLATFNREKNLVNSTRWVCACVEGNGAKS